jgi:HD-GYP domain-containing protein (c-di-GMP phosphodiesterase class II)
MHNLLETEDLKIQFYSNQLQKKIESSFGGSNQTPEALDERENTYLELFKDEFKRLKESCTIKIINKRDATRVSCEYSAWMIAWLYISWKVVFEEVDLLRQVRIQESKEKNGYLNSTLPGKQDSYGEIVSILEKLEQNPEMFDSSEKSYYEKKKSALKKEIEEIKREIQDTDQILNNIDKHPVDIATLNQHFIFFIRGSISRQELTFLSDIDFGYCVNNAPEHFLDYKILQELIKRYGTLIQKLPIESAGLYFELIGDDLTRFNDSKSIYTIPTLMESKAVLGNTSILLRLKEQFQNACLKPKLIKYLNNQYKNTGSRIYELIDIKNGIGGIRHLQTALWSIMICYNLGSGSTSYLLGYLKKLNHITSLDVAQIQIAIQFYLELRNFKYLLSDSENSRPDDDILDQDTLVKYLKLSNRFENIDQLNRQLIFCIQNVLSLSELVKKQIQLLSYRETLQRLILEKNYSDNRIIKYQPVDTTLELSWLVNQKKQKNKAIEKLFSHPLDLIELLLNISQTGGRLDIILEKKLANNFDQLIDLVRKLENSDISSFLRQAFIAPYTSDLIAQMWEISIVDDQFGQVKSLFGLFIPEADQMRYLRRNTEIHEYPLCVHSNKALKTIEFELKNIRQNDPALLSFLNEDSIFALKWSCLFHDIGKIYPDLNHEKTGPKLVVQILDRLDWKPSQRILGLIRLLVEHHQSVVKFSRLSTYTEIGINKYLELAERDPRRVLLLYLINVSDYKSVNRMFRQKTASIDSIFQETMEIFHQLKNHGTDKTITKIVNGFLDKKIIEAKNQVAIMSLLQRCITEDVENVFLKPLSAISKQEYKAIHDNTERLNHLINAYSQSFEDNDAKKTILIQFSNIINNNISLHNFETLLCVHFPNWDWFFNAIPNRLILSLTNEELSLQLSKFPLDDLTHLYISIIKGEAGEYDTLLFRTTDLKMQKKLAFILNQKSINIENGKINHVRYQSGVSGVVGFLHFSISGNYDISAQDLEASIDNLKLPDPKSEKVEDTDAAIYISHYQDDERGYIVEEISQNKYARRCGLLHYVKISTSDQRYRFFKILKTMEDIGVVVKQSTITTIGSQINDYFIFNDEDFKSLDLKKLQNQLEENLRLSYE